VSPAGPVPAERLAGALAGSVLLHAALLAALGAAPREWLLGVPGGRPAPQPLTVRFPAAAPVAEPAAPAQPSPPEASPTPTRAVPGPAAPAAGAPQFL